MQLAAGGGDGNGAGHCILYGSSSLSGPDQDAYDLDVTRIGGTKYVFIATHPKNGQNAAEDLWIYNVNNEASPQLVSAINTNNVDNLGINSIIVARLGSGAVYAYLGNDDNKDHLIAVNVTNPALPGTPTINGFTGTGNDRITDLDFFNNKLYVAIGNKVRVYTLTNPDLPTLQTTYTLGGNVNKISFNEDFLYAAVADNLGELSRVSLSGGTVTKFNLNGNAANKPGTSIKVLGNRIYLGIQAGHTEDNFYVIDDNGSGFTTVAAHDLPNQNNKKVIDHVVLGNMLFVLVEDSNKEFQVYDISDVQNFTDICTSTNPTNVGFGLDFFENYVYLSMRSNSELQIFSDHEPAP